MFCYGIVWHGTYASGTDFGNGNGHCSGKLKCNCSGNENGMSM